MEEKYLSLILKKKYILIPNECWNNKEKIISSNTLL